MKAKKPFLCILLLFLYACQGKEDTEKRTELQQKEEIIEEKSLQETEKVKKEEMTEEQNRKMSIKEAGIANKKRKMQNSKIEKKLKKFVPRGWRILQFVTRDLNKDKLEDVAIDRKSTRLNSSHANISYAVFCLKKKMIALEGLRAADPTEARCTLLEEWGRGHD